MYPQIILRGTVEGHPGEENVGFRVIVCGSRRWRDRYAIANRLFDLPTDSVVVHGGAQGADRIAKQEAEKLGLLVEEHRAEWGTYGRRAGPLRNIHMAALGADLCIAFWDGRSTGTKHMLEQAEAYGIPTEVHYRPEAA